MIIFVKTLWLILIDWNSKIDSSLLEFLMQVDSAEQVKTHKTDLSILAKDIPQIPILADEFILIKTFDTKVWISDS